MHNPLKKLQINLPIKINLKTLIKRVDTEYKLSIIRPHQDGQDNLYVDYI